MKNKKKLNLLKQVKDFINEMGGIDESQYIKIGITFSELLDPTEETLIKLHEYKFKLNAKKEDIERLGF